MGKITVGLLFGGKSSEHEISLLSAKNVIEALDRNKYDLVLIGIDKNGRWLSASESLSLLDGVSLPVASSAKNGVALLPDSQGELIDFSANSARKRVDVVFPVLHGASGEDGTVQGLLKLAGLPFVGADVLGSAIGMDKEVMKRLLKEAGLAIADFLALRKWQTAPDYDEVIKKLGENFFVKPANSGSSVGISKVHSREEYDQALVAAFLYDNKVLLEAGIKGREIECAVLGNESPQASVPGEIIPQHEFYSYEAKYFDEKGALLEVPAKLDSELAKEISALAVRVFEVLSCEGLARVDFFLTDAGQILVNEINTLPGFTAVSMYPRLWQASGIGYGELIDALIDLAMARFDRDKKIKTSYS